MRKMKSIVAMLLCLVMVVGLVAGCNSNVPEKTQPTQGNNDPKPTQGNNDPQPTEGGEEGISYPLDTDVQLRIFVQAGLSVPSGYSELQELPFIQGLEERWGVDIIWEMAPAGSDATAAYNLMLQDADLPQIIFGNKCSTNEVETLINDGVAMDISHLLEEYAPDYWAFLHNKNDTNRVKDLAMATTNNYGLTHFIGPRLTPENGTWAGTAIRKDWLDELGLEVPETLEEVDYVARKFHEVYGAVVTGPKTYFANCRFMADGTGSMGTWQYATYLDGDEVKLANMGQDYKEYLEFMHSWYEDGILDQNFSGGSPDSLQQMVNEEKTGLICTSVDLIPKHNEWAKENGLKSEWIPIPNIVENKGDMAKAAHANYSAWVGKAGSFITTNCTEEQLMVALAILNWGYTEEGMIYWNYGAEGVSFEYDENGNPQFTDMMLNHELGLTEARKIYTGGTTNTLASAQIWTKANGPEAVHATEVFCSNNVAGDYRVPSLTYPDEVKGERTDLYNAIKSYVDEMALKFVTGEESLDNYEAYEKQLEKLGVDRLFEIMTDSYQEFAKRGGIIE